MDKASDLASYISGLFSKDHFPDGVPTTDRATHSYYSDYAGQMAHIVEQLDQPDISVLSPKDQHTLAEAKGHIKHALRKWEHPEHPGRAHGLPARHLATVYHLLKELVVMSDPTARQLIRTLDERSHQRPTPSKPQQSAQPMTQYAGWEIIGTLGSGGQGKVQKVRSPARQEGLRLARGTLAYSLGRITTPPDPEAGRSHAAAMLDRAFQPRDRSPKHFGRTRCSQAHSFRCRAALDDYRRSPGRNAGFASGAVQGQESRGDGGAPPGRGGRCGDPRKGDGSP